MQGTQTRQHWRTASASQGVMRFPRRRSPDDDGRADERSAQRLARALGWFSLSLGLAEIVAPRAISRLLGGNGRYANLIRLYGLREVVSGAMIFAQGERPAGAVWSRVAGDAVDIATLAAAATSPRTAKTNLALATASVLGATALDVYCARGLGRAGGGSGAIRMTRSVVVNRPREELYRFWRDFENLPRFMYHLRAVRAAGPGISHWVANGPAGTTVEWDSRITADTENELIGWQSLEGADVWNAGSVRFESRAGNRGTIVRVDLEYRPPGGIAGKVIATLFNESPEQQIYDDLHRFKQIVETGEVVRSDGSPEGMGPVLQEQARPAMRSGDATATSSGQR